MKTWASGEQLLAADLNNNFLEAAGVVTFVMPDPVYASSRALANGANLTVNTTGIFSAIHVPNRIIINKISFSVASVTTPGTIKFGLFSADGQTRYCNETTATISATGLVTHTLSSPVTLQPGVYYWVGVPVGTANMIFHSYQEQTTAADLLSGVSGKPVQRGTKTVTAGTLPTTFTPSSITNSSNGQMPVMRFDN